MISPEDLCILINQQNTRLNNWKRKIEFINKEIYYCKKCDKYIGLSIEESRTDDEKICVTCGEKIKYKFKYETLLMEMQLQIDYLNRILGKGEKI